MPGDGGAVCREASCTFVSITRCLRGVVGPGTGRVGIQAIDVIPGYEVWRESAIVALDPQVNPLIVFPVLLVLLLLSLVLWWVDGNPTLRLALLVVIGLVVVAFLLSRTPLF